MEEIFSEKISKLDEQRNEISKYFDTDKDDLFGFDKVSNHSDCHAFDMESPVDKQLSAELLLKLRQDNAWLPSDSTKKKLISYSTMAEKPSSPKPSLMIAVSSSTHNTVNDPYRDMLNKLCSKYKREDNVDLIRNIVSADDVSHDLHGLYQLISHGWYRSALDLVHRLLTESGFGFGINEQFLPHITDKSAKLWLTRFHLLVKTQQISLAEKEMEAFQDLDAPDMYYEYYPNSMEKGSIIPFPLRVFHAEFPCHLGKHMLSLDRLSYMLKVTNEILCNLNKGLYEDGSDKAINTQYIKESLKLWHLRQYQLNCSCIHVYLKMHDFVACRDMSLVTLKALPSDMIVEKTSILSKLGRIYMMMGDLYSSKRIFQKVLNMHTGPPHIVEALSQFYAALFEIGRGDYEEAKRLFKSALNLDRQNTLIANNLAVCDLYLGDVREAIDLYRQLTEGVSRDGGSFESNRIDLSNGLNDISVFNLVVLFELTSDNSVANKTKLLEAVARLPGEHVSIQSFKLDNEV